MPVTKLTHGSKEVSQMRAFNAPATRRTATTAVKKSWQWNSDELLAAEKRAKEVQAAQRRFRKAA
jgi:hypothetical protein